MGYIIETPQGNVDVPQRAKVIEIAVPSYLLRSQGLVIVDTESLRSAEEYRHGIDDLLKEISATLDPIRDSAHKTWKASVAAIEKVTAPLKESKQIIDRKISAYVREQERIRFEEQERIRRDEERRLEGERLKEAITAESVGEKERAEEIINRPPAFVPPPVLPSAKEELKGLSVSESWKGEVTDFNRFAEWCVTMGKWNLLAVNQTPFNQYVRAVRNTEKIPGVRVYPSDSVRRSR